MQLLSSTQVSQAKSQERRMEIDEGMKLARKVDALREAYATESTKLQKFRTESVGVVLAEIQGLKDQIDPLKIELSALQEARRIALEPIEVEWERIRAARKQLDEDKRLYDIRSAELLCKEVDIQENELEASEMLKTANDTRKEAERLLSEAKASQRASTDELKAIKADRFKQEKEHAFMMRVLKEKEERLDNDIQHNKDFREELTKRERALTLREKRYGN